jgi:hypothetical protein
MNTAAIANHLNVAEAAIAEIQEWARVLWVRVRGMGARFVSKKVVKMEVQGIIVEEKAWGLVTDSDSFTQDWNRLKELEVQGVARRVGLGIAYECGGLTFVNRERYDTNPETCVQTAVNWFQVITATGVITNPAASVAAWDPREQSNDFDPEEMR